MTVITLASEIPPQQGGSGPRVLGVSCRRNQKHKEGRWR